MDSRHERTRGRHGSSALLYLVFGAIVAFVAYASWAAMNDFSPGDSLPQGSSRQPYPAPDFGLALFDGRELALSDLRGKAVVLNFWASWCPPCRAEARGMERVWQAYEDRGVVFLGVNIQDAEKDARGFLEEFGITYPNGQDTSGEIAVRYGLTGIPETFFITPDGKVVRHWIGSIGEEQLASSIEELLR